MRQARQLVGGTGRPLTAMMLPCWSFFGSCQMYQSALGLSLLFDLCRHFDPWTACSQVGPTSCSLRFGLVSSILGGLKYFPLQCALTMPAMIVSFSSPSSVPRARYRLLSQDSNFDSGARGGGCLHCALRVSHFSCQHGCRSLRYHCRSRSAGDRS